MCFNTRLLSAAGSLSAPACNPHGHLPTSSLVFVLTETSIQGLVFPQRAQGGKDRWSPKQKISFGDYLKRFSHQQQYFKQFPF